MYIRIIVLAGVLLLLSGCIAGSEPGPVRKETDPAVAAGNCLLGAIRDGDYRKFARIVGPEIGERITETRFRESRDRLLKQYGSLRDFSYMTELCTPAVGNHVWKVTFQREGKNGKVIRQDLMFRLITGQDENRLKAVSFGFL